MARVDIRGLHKHCGGQPVLKGIDMTVQAGQVVARIGRSRSCMSSLPRTINGLTALDTGEIDVAGTRLHPGRTPAAVLRAKVGTVFQRFKLFPRLDALHNVTPHCAASSTWRTRCRSRCRGPALAEVGLADKMSLPGAARALFAAPASDELRRFIGAMAPAAMGAQQPAIAAPAARPP